MEMNDNTDLTLPHTHTETRAHTTDGNLPKRVASKNNLIN